jgi:4a-hydroxytetrahydrobiopterin dehydratase
MSDLDSRHCEACRADAPKVTPDQFDELKPEIPEWDVIEVDGVKRLTRSYKFGNFEQALEFSNKVGAIAEQENHHPAILTEWGRVNVTWWTHKIRGLHVNDFIMCARTDALV